MSKRTQKDSGEERVTAKSTPMMNLVSRCSERTLDVLSSTASESPEKTRHKNQFPLTSRTKQHHRTGWLVLDAYSSSYSEWNVEEIWSSQEQKSDELIEDRTGRPVDKVWDVDLNHGEKRTVCGLAASTHMKLGAISANEKPPLEIEPKTFTILQEEETLHYNITIWYTNFPTPQAMKIPAANAAVDKEWEKLENIPAWDLTKVRSKKQVIDEARTSGATVHFASLMDIYHLKNAELEAKHQKK